MIQYFELVGLFNALICFLAGLYVYLQDKSGSVHRSFFVLTITVALWSGFYAIWQTQTTKESALFFFRLTMIPCYYIVFAFLWFVSTLVENKKRKHLFYFCWITPTLFLPFNFTFLGVKDVTQRLFFPFWPVPGLMIHIYFLFFCIILIITFAILFRSLFQSSGSKRQQIQWVTYTMLPAWLAGSTNWFLWYNIPIPPFPYVFVAVIFLLLAYTIVRRQLFNLEAVVQSFQREKLATIGLIASSINHEIRNPLYAAKCVLENYLEEEKGTDSEILSVPFSANKQRSASERALKQITRALDVITKLNRFAKPAEDSGAREQKANIQDALKNVLDLVSYEFSLDKIQIINNIPDDLPEIQADPRQLEEILFNLIVNACHAMSRKLSSPKSLVGDPSLDSRQKHSGMTGEYEGILTIRATSHASRVTVSITDTGCGIPPDQTKHLFEPFRTTKGDKGTGLGLYITKQLVERNGGRISVKSQPNRGTSFILEFSAIV